MYLSFIFIGCRRCQHATISPHIYLMTAPDRRIPRARGNYFTTRRAWADHRRRSSVNCRGHDIFARKICMKNNKMPKFYMIFGRNMPEFFIIIARKIFSRILGGNVPLPPSPAPMGPTSSTLCLRSCDAVSCIIILTLNFDLLI